MDTMNNLGNTLGASESTGLTLNPAFQAGGSAISWGAIKAILWRQRLVLVGIISLVLAIGVISTLLTVPRYEATATVRIDPTPTRFLEAQEFTSNYVGSRDLDWYLGTMAKVLRSRSMATSVVESLDLQDSDVLLADLFRDGQPAGLGDEAWLSRRRSAATGILLSSVDVQIPNDSTVMSITFNSEDSSLAAKIANSYADNFLSASIEREVEATSYARTYLEEQIEEVRGSLRDAEIQAIGYARENRIFGQGVGSAAVGAPATVAAGNLTDINTTYSEARARRIETEQRWRAISGIPAGQLPEVQQSTSIQGMKSQLADLDMELSKLRERYRDDYPEVKELTVRKGSIEGQIEQSSSEIKSGIKNAFEIALRQEQALAREVERVSGQTLDEQDRRVQFGMIDRDADALRAQLESLMVRYNEITSAANIRNETASLLDSAIVSGTPVSPNLFRNILVALVLGGALAFAIALIREVLDDRLRSIEDVERKLGAPALGQTPYVDGDILDDVSDAFSPISESYSSIRATLDYAMPAGDKQVIQFTSSQASEGKTTSSYALASQYAAVGRKVLLVDFDLRRPSVLKLIGRERGDGGVVDVLYSRLRFERAVIRNVAPNLDVLPVGTIPTNPVEILSSGLIPEFLDQVRSLYDIVILDSSPVMGIADAPLLARFADSVVFVVEANRAHHGQARQAIRRLLVGRANVVGVILTKFKSLEAGESYNGEYNYYSYNSDRD